MSCQFVLALFLLGLCICGTSEAVAGLQECTDLLADSAVYYLDLDVADQRAALIDFYDSTGGQYWVNQPADDSEHVIFPQIVEGVIEAGNGLTSGTLDVSALPVELNLSGTLPDVGSAVASKLRALNVGDTGLQQCQPSHLAALGSKNYTGKVVNAGPSSKLGVDNTTGCLPDVLQFCSATATGQSTDLTCPSLAFRRPAAAVPNGTARIEAFLSVLDSTNSLITAFANATAYIPNPTFVDGFLSTTPCPSMDAATQNPNTTTNGVVGVLSYDFGLFSYVGCRCNAGYDNIYTVDGTGRVTQQCQLIANSSSIEVIKIAAGVIGALLFIAFGIVVRLRWRQVVHEFFTARINRVKRRNAPGRLPASVVQDLGLIKDEITLVMTDVQASSRLWEWNPKIMDEALTMHDACLRVALHQHCGYEVLTEGDAFTMAFHDPIDAIAWALDVQHRLLLLPWPAELLTQADAKEMYSPPFMPIRRLMFKGLRVRMAMHTGKPEAIQVHHVTRQVEYRGDVVALTEALVGFPSGGQVLMSGSTYQRVYGNLHTVQFDDHLLTKLSKLSSKKAAPSSKKTGVPGSRNGKSFEVRFQADLDGTGPSTPKADSEMDELLSPRSKRQRPKDEAYTAPRTYLPQRLAGLQSTYHDAASDDSRDADSVESGDARAEQVLEINPNFPEGRPEPSGVGQIRAALAGAWTRLLKLLWQLLPCCMKKKVAPTEGSFFRKWHSSESDVNSMVMSTSVQGSGKALMVDMGAFHLAEFAQTLCLPFVGSAVHGGVHVVQVVSQPLAMRMLMIPALDDTFKVAPTFGDAPGVLRDTRAKAMPPPGLHSSGPPSSAQGATVAMVFCAPAQYKELLHLDAVLAESALRHFQSCVRTTLLLCNGYECQEKDGLFMIAFGEARGAVEWSVLLQLALLRVDWEQALDYHDITAEVRSTNSGQLLMKGLMAKIGIVPGMMAKICPHGTTGRADYFGSAVNRAARLLCAAQAGQVLVEEHVMDSVITDWRGDGGKPKSCPWVKGLASADASIGPIRSTGKRKLHIDVGKASAGRPGGKSRSLDEPVELHSRSKSMPLNEIRRQTLTGRLFVPTERFMFRAQSPESVSSRESSDTGEEQAEEAYCSPYASHSPLAVNNCHMLNFLGKLGRVEGRKESGVLRSNAYRSLASRNLTRAVESSRHLLRSAGNSLDPNFQAVTNPTAVSSPQDSQIPSASHKVAWFDGLNTEIAKQEEVTASGIKAKHVWTPILNKGKPFPMKRMPVEVWAIGEFRFKGISGVSKVMEVLPGELAERMDLHPAVLQPGKATCVLAARSRRCLMNIQLMDVLDLQLSL
ncbi:MAG: serine threonine kinase [Trebouxia sp. A1-2]|nr:MAG: serine threonine kinase [Trebouxia sp. A1-2]